mgnify:CR=1 FL=1
MWPWRFPAEPGANGFDGIAQGQSPSSYQVGYASSTDGLNWTKDANNPVFSPSSGTGFDSDDAGVPRIFEYDGVPYMLYVGGNGVTLKIGLAEGQ